MDCSPLDSSLHGISHARILEQVAILFFGGFSWLRDWTSVSALASRFFTTETTGKSSKILKSVCVCVFVKVTRSCPTLCHLMDCRLPGSSVHGILQARILEWVSIYSSRGTSQPRDRTQVSHIVGIFFTIWATREAQKYSISYQNDGYVSLYICSNPSCVPHQKTIVI